MLVILAVPMLLLGFCVSISSKGNALFKQKRMGAQGRLFEIYKFRSMVQAGNIAPGSMITIDGDDRITTLGRWLRKYKLDELPQLYNVLRGDMSLVGPRPRLPQHSAILDMPYRPGITGPATLVFRREEEALRLVNPSDIDRFYAERVKPLKAVIDVRYMSRATFWSDMALIAATFMPHGAGNQIPTVVRSLRLPAISLESLLGIG